MHRLNDSCVKPQSLHVEPCRLHQAVGRAPQEPGRTDRTRHSFIGEPIRFTEGQWAGQTVRAELHEIQKANLGRKYGRVDRRPLDPPPAILLKLFVVTNAGTEHQRESEVENYDNVKNLGLLCNVDLFPVSDAFAQDQRSPQRVRSNHCSDSSISASSTSPFDTCQPRSHPRPVTFISAFSPSRRASLPPPPLHTPNQERSAPAGWNSLHSDGSEHNAFSRSLPPAEHERLTTALVGTTFVQPVYVDYQGKKALVFVFADLAVNIEGTFILRYRAFDIYSKAFGSDDFLIQAECYGGPFRVYSTKEFPGLQPSTELTKQLARYGVRLNIRETERRRRKRDSEEGSDSPSLDGDGGHKRRSSRPMSDQ